MQPATLQETIVSLSLRLLGPFQAQVDGLPLIPRHSRKEQWLLALLTLRHDRGVERDWLAGTLWPESHKSRTLLRDTLSDLRQALGSQAGRLCTPTAHTLCLNLSGADVDVLAFDAAIARGDTTSLEEAVRLYGGPLLEGCTEAWALVERAAREQAFVKALETLADQALAQGNAMAAVEYLQRAIPMDPLRESVQRALMQALAAGGDYAAAVLVYRNLRLLLRRELQADPDPETTALFHHIRQEARLHPQRPAAISTASPSTQGSGSSDSKAASGSPSNTPPNNLPIPVTSFIGRESEREAIKQLLSTCRLVTLTGAGGCGKTRLALQVAAEVLQEDPVYSDGVWLVELASLSAAELMPQRIAQALGITETPDRSLQETLLIHLKSRRLLLVLDNCEHLLEACAPLTEAFLQHCAGLRILATSRQSLGIHGESAYPAPSMRQPDLQTLPTARKELVAVLAGYDSVRLFVERARAQRPDFALTEHNALSLAEICHRLDGIPLAIEFAAARILSLTPAQIAARLDDRFRLLTGGSRTALPRQQTLKATLDWSYELLTPPEQRLLQRLTVFTGGWTLEAAEQVTGDRLQGTGENPAHSVHPPLASGDEGEIEVGGFPVTCNLSPVTSHEVLDLLTSLVGKSLVLFEEQEGQAAGRYRLLEMVRQYARERLAESREEKALRDRHRDYFLALAEDANRQHYGNEQAEWLHRLEAEHDNLRLALEWCRREGGAEAGLRLAGALWQFWWTRNYAREGWNYLMEMLAREEAAGRTPERAKALRGAGVLALHQDKLDAAKALQEESLALFQELGDKRGIADSLHWLGIVSIAKREMAEARALQEQSLALFQQIEDRWGVSYVLNVLGMLCEYQHNFMAARALYAEALELQQALGGEKVDKFGIACSLFNLGNAAHAEGDYEAARALYEESLALRKELGDRQGIANALRHLGRMAMAQGDYAAARARYEESLAIRRGWGDRPGMAYSLENLADLAHKQGDYAAAQAQYEQSLTILQELEDIQGVAWLHYCLGNLAIDQSDLDTAKTRLALSQKLFLELGITPGLVFLLEAWARLALVEDQPGRAAQLGGAAEAQREMSGSPLPGWAREQYDRHKVAVQQALGEEAFASLWSEGRQMTPEQAATAALDGRLPSDFRSPRSLERCSLDFRLGHSE